MTIRKIKRDPAELGALSLFAQLDEPSVGGSISDPPRRAAVLEKLAKGLDTSLASEARLHGWRVQAMFESMILGLGSVRLLSSEDEGDCHFDDADGRVKPPDFRLVTNDSEHLLIEVKNVAPRQAFARHTMPVSELEGMQRYAEWTQARLTIAHYWSQANLWTLVDASRLAVSGRRALLTLEAAMRVNELGFLGDRMIATTPPLVLSLYPSEGTAPEVDPDSETASFRVGKVAISAGGQPVHTKVERTIAFQLMLFGGWPLNEKSTIDNGRLVRHDYEFGPHDPEGVEAKQGFSVVTSLSSLHATRYTFTTLVEDRFEALRLEPEPGALSAIVPADYWERPHRSLQLWLFQIHPSAIR
jgi:hypothetical protein